MTMWNRNRYSLICSFLLATLAGPVSASGKIGGTVGNAYDLKSGELLYRETHCVGGDGLDREVLYQDVNGKLIARKLLDYSSGFITPSFVQHNYYSNESIEVGLEQGAVSMAVIDLDDRSDTKAAVEQPGVGSPVVIDAGFDGFVRQHWDELVAGATREFQFPFAKRQSLVDLRIQPLSCSYQTKTDQCFRLDLANWLLRVAVKPIELGYDVESRRLTRYRGLSNIGDADGNGLEVDIRYDYDAIAPQACQQIDRTLSRNDNVDAVTEEQS